MSSSAASSSSSSLHSYRTASSRGTISYTQCYEVVYSVGPMSKQGARKWLDGRLTYHSYNKKIFLRDTKAVLVDEGFYLSRSRAGSRTEGGKTGREAIFEPGETYQLMDIYTVLIKKLRSTHEKMVDPLAMKNYAQQKKERKASPSAKDMLERAPDILLATLGEARSKSSSDELRGIKRACSALGEKDVNSATTSSEAKSRSKLSSEDSDYSRSGSSSKRLSDILDVRCRASGLSKKARRSS